MGGSRCHVSRTDSITEQTMIEAGGTACTIFQTEWIQFLTHNRDCNFLFDKTWNSERALVPLFSTELLNRAEPKGVLHYSAVESLTHAKAGRPVVGNYNNRLIFTRQM